MGKRRRPSRKPKYEDIGDIQMRMAGDAMTEDQVLEALVDQALSDIRGETREDELIQEAMDYLPARREELAQLFPTELAGASRRGQALVGEAELAKLGRLQGDVPMPRMYKQNNSEVRRHTKYVVDPTTGQEIIVPVIDPMTNQPVVTVYGRDGIDSAAGHQSEPAMKNAGALMGYKSTYNDPEGTGKADLKFVDGDRVEKVDVMHRDLRNPLAIPMYTALTPMEGGRMVKNFSRDKSAYRKVGRLVDQRLAQQGNNDIYSAVESLVDEGKIGPRQGRYRSGKLLRAQEFVPEESRYDSLLVPGYGGDLASRKGASSQQYTPTAPDTIQKVDLREALASLQGGMDGVKVKRVSNYGYGGNKYERMQMKPEFADNAPGIVDATIDAPILQQLLSRRAMEQRLI